MKGIIMQCREQKSIVLFNNGKIGEIPTPPDCEEGMIITVSYNKKIIALVSLLSCVVLICVVLALRFVYYNPVGYIQINYETASLELAYNRFQRILAVRPLNLQAVEPIAILSLDNTKITTAYEKIILAFAPAFPAGSQIFVRIAQDNLTQAKKIEESLALLSTPLKAASQKELYLTFELYTNELYREAMITGSQGSAISPLPASNSASQMHGHNMGMNSGRNLWCW